MSDDLSPPARRLRYSERQAVAETGDLGPLVHDVVPQPLRNSLLYVVQEALGKRYLGPVFAKALHTTGVKYFGWNENENVATALSRTQIPAFLDLVEIITDVGSTKRYYQTFSGGQPVQRRAAALPDFEPTFNELADRHRFGYRSEGGELRRLGSPALSERVVGPALFAAQRAGWEHVEAAFREALSHQRAGSDENDDALTAASAALESALKAVGLTGSTLGELARGFKHSRLGAPQLTGVPDLLDKLLQRSGAVRNILGDAHGKGPGENLPVPQELVDLTIHLVGSFVVYLEAAERNGGSASSPAP